MNVFEKLKNGEPVDMMSEEYLPAIAELQRADRALFHLNHAEPQSEEQKKAFEELFDGAIMKAAATTWKERRARINTISPGVIVTPLAYDEFAAAGEGYQKMVDASAAERCGTSDEIAEAGAFLLGEHAGFITGTDLLIDGGVIAAIRTGTYSLNG